MQKVSGLHLILSRDSFIECAEFAEYMNTARVSRA
jgi:hypothetical protein